MARARNIKPSFFLNEELSEVPYEARLFFIGLWCLCDPQGKMEFRPKRVKVELFPYDNVDCTRLAQCLHQAGLIKFYTVDSQDYIWVPMFTKHQTPHFKESIKGYPDYSECYDIASGKPSASPVQAPPDILIADMLNPDVLNEESAPKVATLEKPKPKAKRNANPSQSLTEHLEASGGIPPMEWGEWTHSTLGWNTDRISFEWDDFFDYWTSGNAKGGGRKSDWPATWRSHCRRNAANSRRGYASSGKASSGLAAAFAASVAARYGISPTNGGERGGQPTPQAGADAGGSFDSEGSRVIPF